MSKIGFIYKMYLWNVLLLMKKLLFLLCYWIWFKKVEFLEYRGNLDYFFLDFGFYYDMFCGVLIFKNKMLVYFCIFFEGLILFF